MRVTTLPSGELGDAVLDTQARWAAIGAPRIPGCYVFMHGLSDRRT